MQQFKTSPLDADKIETYRLVRLKRLRRRTRLATCFVWFRVN
jgi:hypothetical protein